jgi:putative tryptophan/tyrosine transport system substrate-binding protein
MRRRGFIAGLLVAATMGRAQAQQTGKVYRIAIVSPATPVGELTENGGLPFWRAFFEELRRLGYVEGQNIVIDRFSGRTDRYPELVREVVRRNPDLIWVSTPRLTLDFKAATATIPIAAFASDPIAYGIVASLARPGGNITGVAGDTALDVSGKRLALLKQTIPTLSKVGYLTTRTSWEGPGGAALREMAQRVGVSLIGPPLDGLIQEAEFRRVFAAMAQAGVEALFVSGESEIFANRRLIVELANKARLPSIYQFREHAELGGLTAYAYDFPDIMRHSAGQVDRILKGTKPGEIPYYQETKFELVINLKTAKTLGLTIPPSLLTVADEVIE